MASRFLELKQREHDLKSEMRQLAGKVEQEGRAMTADERSRRDEIMGSADNRGLLAEVQDSISIIEQSRQWDREADNGGIDPNQAADNAAADEGPTPFKSLGEQLLAIAHGTGPGRKMDERQAIIQAATGASEAVPSDGGLLLQGDFTTEILRNVYRSAVIANKVKKRTIVNGNSFVANAIDETSRANGSRLGGIQAYWTGEAEQKTASKPKFRKLRVELEKLTGVYVATDELLEDAPVLEQEISDWFSDEFKFKIDDAIFRGTGAGMPLGWLNSNAYVSQAAEGGQTADTVNATNIQKMFARMPASSLANAEWYIGQEVWPYLFAMNQANMPIFMPGGSLANAPFGMLMGRPINPIEQASAIGDVGDIVFADFSNYILVDKGDIKRDVSIHVYFLTDETTFRFVLRINGQPIPQSAVTPYLGAASLSPFVTLAAR